jgi:SAM-dependent methyltransferase
MPVKDVSDFSYVDLGSGKGRTLFVAAEWPFRQVIGVEFSRLLHEQACANIRTFRRWSRRCGPITSVEGDAREFVFPEGKFVLYMFNPFGQATMAEVLGNLERSLRQRPRHVVIVLLWPKCGDMVAPIEGMRLRSQTRRWQIFEAFAD